MAKFILTQPNIHKQLQNNFYLNPSKKINVKIQITSSSMMQPNLYYNQFVRMSYQKSKDRILKINQDNLDDAARFIARGFNSMNKIYKHFNMSQDEITSIFRGKILPSLREDLCFIALQNNKVNGVVVSLDMVDILSNPQHPHHVDFFQKSARISSELHEKLGMNKIPPKGELIYGAFAVVDPESKILGSTLIFVLYTLGSAKLSGYKEFYSRLTNQTSLKLFLTLGAKIIGQTSIEEGNLRQKIWMVRFDLEKSFPTYKQLKRRLNLRKNQNLNFDFFQKIFFDKIFSSSLLKAFFFDLFLAQLLLQKNIKQSYQKYLKQKKFQFYDGNEKKFKFITSSIFLFIFLTILTLTILKVQLFDILKLNRIMTKLDSFALENPSALRTKLFSARITH